MTSISHRLAALLLASAVATIGLSGCGGDDEKEANSTTTVPTVEVAEDEQAWCDAARATQVGTASGQSEAIKELIELSPPDLKADHEAIAEFIEYRDANMDDASGIAERQVEVAGSFERLINAVRDRCGFSLVFK